MDGVGEAGAELKWKTRMRIFLVDGNALCLDCEGGYITVQVIYQAVHLHRQNLFCVNCTS